MTMIAALMVGLLSGFVQDDKVASILEKVRTARPSEADLAIYQLDWIPDFEKAKARAASEKRPFLFLWNRNITGPDSLYSGHC